MVGKFRKLPVVIEAVLYRGNNWNDIMGWSKGKVTASITPNCLSVETLEGVITANIGDWIIRGVNGEFYPCKPDIFDKTYEPVLS